jgi:filamentous hemagglutinin family protein
MSNAYRLASAVLAAGFGCTWMGAVEAGPKGGTVVAGDGTIHQSGNTTTISQQSQNLAVNWLGFSIGPAETVQFIQPSSSAVALNRVTGNEASQIYGHLVANGQVFLINPNGVLFGSSAQVNVGSLVASTLNITDADFLARNYKFKGNADSSGTAAPAGIINQGTLIADGGTVALLGGHVSNVGTIRAQLGSVALAAGGAMTLDFQGNKLLSVKVDESAIGALAENRQLIQANGGTVIMTAAARNALLSTVVNNTGVIE